MIENAANLLALLQIATGKGREAGPVVKARLDELKKPAPPEGNQNRRDNTQRSTEWPDFLLAPRLDGRPLADVPLRRLRPAS